ncbi:putative NADH dehydrogenase/NAD(P)H nitroreductase [Desulfamplus magnetovallimortis]|uniref:Putative NADH dehydrogenase/NAD(P)H nitroreductase n=1 Tax=Desulfamplus magnetovallimortis TaxID=1246637 RepID=A0A1W1H8P4_9BACT|nr:nitroreductase family protein [Desulfamplus magnetovallimortis]SLM28823.1 putative NADH dehydrogenase/NAD(P)H nitroreductase [Desulfamplus magnetovallimortis]
MELFEALHTRRSIRQYEDREISSEIVKKILASAMMAPSTADARTWHFILVTDSKIKDRIKDVHPYVGMVTKSPLSILICGDLSKEKFQGFWPQDCSAAMQNLLLAAHGLGLGAVWTGIYPIEDRVDKFRDILDLPENIIPFGMAVMGWPAQTVQSKERYDEGLIHLNKWGAPAYSA